MKTELSDVVRGALPKLRAISEADASMKPAPGKWSKKEILGHLIDSAANNHQRLVRLQSAAEVTLPGYDQEAWVAAGRYQQRPWTDLIELWAAYTDQISVLIEGIREDVGGHVWHHPDRDFTLTFVAEDYVRHQRHHLKQIGVE